MSADTATKRPARLANHIPMPTCASLEDKAFRTGKPVVAGSDGWASLDLGRGRKYCAPLARASR